MKDIFFYYLLNMTYFITGVEEYSWFYMKCSLLLNCIALCKNIYPLRLIYCNPAHDYPKTNQLKCARQTLVCVLKTINAI